MMRLQTLRLHPAKETTRVVIGFLPLPYDRTLLDIRLRNYYIELIGWPTVRGPRSCPPTMKNLSFRICTYSITCKDLCFPRTLSLSNKNFSSSGNKQACGLGNIRILRRIVEALP